jgi:twinkle protein
MTAKPFRKIELPEITAYLRSKNIVFNDKFNQLECKDCPNCHATTQHADQRPNQYRLYIAKDGGAFKCHRCNWQGSWYDLKAYYGDNNVSIGAIKTRKYARNTVFQEFTDALPFNSDVRDCLTSRKIKTTTMLQYKIGQADTNYQQDDASWRIEKSMSFPFMLSDTECSFVKQRSLEKKHNMRIEPAGAELIPFGCHLVPDTVEEVFVTEGEIDAMTIFQETGFPVVSLPNGSRSFPAPTIAYLQKFKRVIIAVDSDAAGLDCRTRLAEKLGIKKCTYIDWHQLGENIKDANDALMAGHDLANFLLADTQFEHDAIVTASSYKEIILANLTDKNAYLGVPITSMPEFTKHIGGLRMGELNVISGPTGSGKTTLISQQSMDLAKQGVATLWGSFEIPNEDLISKMLNQVGKKNFTKDQSDFDKTFDKLEQLPLWFMKFHSATKMEDVIDAMDYAVEVFDVRHIIIDNLQFMIGSIMGNEKFDIQNKVIDLLRDFKRDKHVAVTLLAHPKKYDVGKEMTENDLFGSVKLSQDADNIYVIDPSGDYMKFTVRKNRKMGAFVSGAGMNKRKCVHYRFDKETETAIEVDVGHMERIKTMNETKSLFNTRK